MDDVNGWGLSFVVPGLIIIFFGIVMWLFLVPRPEGNGCLKVMVISACVK